MLSTLPQRSLRPEAHARFARMFFNFTRGNVMSLLITVIVITGFTLGRKVARYLGV